MKNFPTDVDARSALLSHRVDAWVTDRFVAKEMIAKAPNAGMKLGDMVFVERIAAAVAKGNQALADAWSKALAQTMADGSYTALSQNTSAKTCAATESAIAAAFALRPAC